ncbi:transmembrane protein 33-containing Krueppel homolog 2 [Lycorma delicatula]|uniref:transmembrane protein 33-containing Krueppel homolog 2 n=1 Tax=Lycorma delicatula TaxID=130591 RepID=UPI003F51ABB1
MPEADSNSEPRSEPVKGFDALKRHCIENKLDIALWTTRLFTIIFTLAYLVPLFGNPYNVYYKALFANGATSAIRLHQRLPAVSFSREFLTILLLEDSCHYLFYSIIFLYVSPVTFALLPTFLFSLIHFASYSLSLLDTLGQNSWWGARLLISIVEFQSRNILRLIAFAEIILMPFTIILIFMGRAGILTPFVYYHFLSLRYNSRRNPYTRNMFHELRLVIESTAAKPGMPSFIRNSLYSLVAITCRLAPQQAQPSQ